MKKTIYVLIMLAIIAALALIEACTGISALY